MKKIAGLMLCLMLMFAPVAQAAEFAGNDYMENGGDNVAWAIFLNLTDLAGRWAANELNVPLDVHSTLDGEIALDAQAALEMAVIQSQIGPYENLPGVKQLMMA